MKIQSNLIGNYKQYFNKYVYRVTTYIEYKYGAGLIDFMTKAQIDPQSGDTLPPFGVEDGTSQDATEPYKKIRGTGVEENALFLVKANAPVNTEAFTYVQTQMGSNKMKFLIDEQQAKTKLMSTKRGQAMTIDQRNDYLIPFVETTILREQMANLVKENEGVNIILKQNTKSIKKDKFSAVAYGM